VADIIIEETQQEERVEIMGSSYVKLPTFAGRPGEKAETWFGRFKVIYKTIYSYNHVSHLPLGPGCSLVQLSRGRSERDTRQAPAPFSIKIRQ